MSKWEMVKLGDICEGITDGSHNPPRGIEHSDYLMISSKNVFNDFISLNEPRYLSEEDFIVEDRRTKISKGDVLLTIVGTIGRTAVVPEGMPKFTLQRSVAVLKPNSQMVVSRYLMYVLMSIATLLERSARGVAQKGIYLGQLKLLEIPLPPLETQKQVAKTLDTAAELLAMRKQQLAELDNLIKSIFYDMFGDPVTNEKGWEKTLLGDLIEDIKYGTSTPPVFTDKGYCFIRATNIKLGRITENDMKYISESEATKISKCKLKVGDLIIVRSGVNTGDTCVITEKYLGQYAGYDLIITPNHALLDSHYLNELINTNYMEKVIKPLTRRAAQPHLNVEQTKNLPIIIPTIELQKHFVSIVTKIEEQKALVKQAIDETQYLFDSLMSEYFE